MYLAFVFPMNLALGVHLILLGTRESYAVFVFMLLTFLYSFKSSKIFYNIQKSLIKERNKIHKQFRLITQQSYNIRQYLNAIDEVGIGIFTLNNKGLIVRVNNTVKKWFGDLVGLKYDDYIKSVKKEKDGAVLATKDGRYFEVVDSKIKDMEGRELRREIF
jgi:hypothetical protein